MVGSLHSMSYLRPHRLKDRIINWLKRAQTVSIFEQYEKCGIRAFDIHLYFLNKNGKAIFKCGNTEYETFSVFEILNYLNSKQNVYVRIVLEDLGEHMAKDCRETLKIRFINYCQIIESVYKNIHFFGGYREFDLKRLYKFKGNYIGGIMFCRRVDRLIK